ncbi:MAG: hypothetical protein ACYC9O_21250 [Candidatus Latescibacterota bacterium]
MKRFLWIIGIMLFASTGFGQGFEDEETGGFGGAALQITALNGNAAVLGGLRGGYIFNRRATIGGGYYHILNEINAPEPSRTEFGRNLNLTLEYLGVEGEYNLRPAGALHYSLYGLLGIGFLNYADGDDNTFTLSDRIYLFEPGVSVSYDLTSWMRLDTRVGYRIVAGVNRKDLDSSDVSNPEVTLTLEFGKFGPACIPLF